jgi:alpha-beta hydrolase superfamily lysophospholipase
MTVRLAPVTHNTTEIDGVEIFYRAAGPPDAPVLLLPHGYPSSSFGYRHFMAALGDRWRLIAPDLPGFGYSATPERGRFGYTFDGYADWLERFTVSQGTRALRALSARLWLAVRAAACAARSRAGRRADHPERRHLRGRDGPEVRLAEGVLGRADARSTSPSG